jgi:hypothetical protein
MKKDCIFFAYEKGNFHFSHSIGWNKDHLIDLMDKTKEFFDTFENKMSE